MGNNKRRSGFSRWLMGISLVTVLFLLLPWSQLGAAPQDRPPTQLPRFLGTVTYDPGTGSPSPRAGVTVSLYGFPAGGGPPELQESAVTGPDGSYVLSAASSAYESFAIVKDEPRGLVPDGATAGTGGTTARTVTEAPLGLARRQTQSRAASLVSAHSWCTTRRTRFSGQRDPRTKRSEVGILPAALKSDGPNSRRLNRVWHDLPQINRS